MHPLSVTLSPADASPTGLADDNDSTGSSVTLDGTLTSGGIFTSSDNLGRQIIITDAGSDNQATATYTVTGTDVNDNSISESLAGPGSSASVTTTKFFKTVSSVTIANPVATSTVDIGTNGLFESKAYPCNYKAPDPNGYTVTLSGTCTYTVYETRTNLLEHGTAAANWIASVNMASKSATAAGESARAICGCKIQSASYSSGAILKFDLVRQGS